MKFISAYTGMLALSSDLNHVKLILSVLGFLSSTPQCFKSPSSLSVFLLTTLKQELSGESGEEKKKSQLTGLVAALGKCFVPPGGLMQSAFI